MRKGLVFVSLFSLLLFIGCIKPYHEATMVDIGTSEVAFLIETVNANGQAVIAPPGKGETENQGKTIESGDFYKQRLVNARKVEIPYYWKPTSRVIFFEDSTNGEWQPAARLIVVDTAPETRHWSKNSSGTAQPIWVESKDSVGFSTGISVTARIENKEDAIKFLSNYPPEENRTIQTRGGAEFFVEVARLSQIMDEELRTKIQEVYAYEAAAETMDLLREKKREIIDTVSEEVIPFFKERGITITAIGQFGGFTYENPEIQKAIDGVFEAQQDEEVAKAEAKAAQERKLALQLKGEGQAQEAVEIARGKADGVKLEAEAEAEAIKAVADAKAYEIEKLSSNPEAYIMLKKLEIDMERVNNWDGKYPSYLFQTGGGDSDLGIPQILLTTPKNDLTNE